MADIIFFTEKYFVIFCGEFLCKRTKTVLSVLTNFAHTLRLTLCRQVSFCRTHIPQIVRQCVAGHKCTFCLHKHTADILLGQILPSRLPRLCKYTDSLLADAVTRQIMPALTTKGTECLLSGKTLPSDVALFAAMSQSLRSLALRKDVAVYTAVAIASFPYQTPPDTQSCRPLPLRSSTWLFLSVKITLRSNRPTWRQLPSLLPSMPLWRSKHIRKFWAALPCNK